MSPSLTADPYSDVMFETSFGGIDDNSDYAKLSENAPTSLANTPDLVGNTRKLEVMYQVLEGDLDPISQPTVILSHTNDLKIKELTNTETDPPYNHQDNGSTPPVSTQTSLPQSPPEEILVASAKPLQRPHVEDGDAALQDRNGDLPYVRLLGADYMLYSVYQDWVHQNTGDHLDGGIMEEIKWQSQRKNLYVCRPNATTCLPGKSGIYLWESCL